MKIFFQKSLKELQLEKENENYKEKIQQLQQDRSMSSLCRMAIIRLIEENKSVGE